MLKIDKINKIGAYLILMLSFIGCTEIYLPTVNSNSNALVVEGLITDGSGPFTVKLTEVVPYIYDSVLDNRTVSGAKIVVSDSENKTFEFAETAKGMYSLPATFKANIGNSYKLHIETTDGNIFESTSEKLQEPLSYDSIKGFSATGKFIDKNNETITVDGSDIRVNLEKPSTDSIHSILCRFKSEITIQYSYKYRIPDTLNWHWFYFGWQSFKLNENTNITEVNTVGTTPTNLNYLVCFVPIGTSNYGFDIPKNAINYYYLRISQYTLNKDAYLFYKEANNQLVANGKIFDPVTSQLYGNIKCINNPSKIVLGLFEVSSVKKYAYILDVTVIGRAPILHSVPDLENINSEQYRYRIWDIDRSLQPDNSLYTIIPFPVWWYHYK